MTGRPSQAPSRGGRHHGGATARVELVVAEADTALAVGSGDVAVLATPRLLALCEEASCRALDATLGEGRTSVASRIQFDHLAPAGVGDTVVAEATLVKTEGRRLHFTLSATLAGPARTGLVGAGRLTRVVVDRQSFMAKVGDRPLP